jgi:hypothetical protein
MAAQPLQVAVGHRMIVSQHRGRLPTCVFGQCPTAQARPGRSGWAMARLPEITDAGREIDLQELRGPLDSMLAYLELVLAEDMSEQERRRFLEVVHSSAVRLRNLVDERHG